MTFCPISSPTVINEIKYVLCINVVKGHDLCLGLPTFFLRSKRIQFSSLRDRLCNRSNWRAAKLFSTDGREVLIKSILQAILSYAMSCFKILISLYKELEQLCAKFWWRSSNRNSGVHWATWPPFVSQNSWGLGFRSRVEFNKALIAKQVWRIIQYPDSLRCFYGYKLIIHLEINYLG